MQSDHSSETNDFNATIDDLSQRLTAYIKRARREMSHLWVPSIIFCGFTLFARKKNQSLNLKTAEDLLANLPTAKKAGHFGTLEGFSTPTDYIKHLRGGGTIRSKELKGILRDFYALAGRDHSSQKQSFMDKSNSESSSQTAAALRKESTTSSTLTDPSSTTSSKKKPPATTKSSQKLFDKESDPLIKKTKKTFEKMISSSAFACQSNGIFRSGFSLMENLSPTQNAQHNATYHAIVKATVVIAMAFDDYKYGRFKYPQSPNITNYQLWKIFYDKNPEEKVNDGKIVFTNSPLFKNFVRCIADEIASGKLTCKLNISAGYFEELPTDTQEFILERKTASAPSPA